MGAINLRAFGGMIPVRDDRLLPEVNAATAANVWLYKGTLEALRTPRPVYTLTNPSTRYVFRVPKEATDLAHIVDSYWLEFANINTTVVKSPVNNLADPTYYWASGTHAPGYTTKSRLEAGDPTLKLGIPTPAVAPGVVPSGGVGASDTRAYVYTWVSEYGEEGPPSPPTTVTGKIDDTWAISMTAPTVGDTTDRALASTRIYRTVTSAQGVATFYFVAEIPIATLAYNDTQASSVITGNEPLASTNWTAPPEDLDGIASMANGMLIGWRGNELWFCEPYRPHAWPAQYSFSVDYDVVGIGTIDQLAVIGTQAVAYAVTGVHPSTMTSRKIAGSEPCISRGSFVGTPSGVYYASPNGLIFATAGGAQNITLNFISKDRWAELLNLSQLRAGLLNGAYFVFSGVIEGVFQPDAFQDDAFQFEDFSGTRDGAIIGLDGIERTGFMPLHNEEPTYNVLQDPWTSELLLLRDGKVLVEDLTYDQQADYSWTSKIFQLAKPENLGVVKITWTPPVGDAVPAATFKTYANGKLRQSRPVPASASIFRLPSGFKADNYQFQIDGNIVVHSIEVASTATELQGV